MFRTSHASAIAAFALLLCANVGWAATPLVRNARLTEQTGSLSEPAKTAAAAPVQKHELHLTSTTELSYADITGPGRASSNYNQGLSYWQVLSVNGKGNFGGLQYTHSFAVRFSDDTRRNNGSIFGLQKAAFGLIYKDAKLAGGDFYESYSQYTNRTQLQGVNFTYTPAKKNAPEVRAMFGYAYARWDQIWRAEDLKVKRRSVAGANIRQAFKNRVKIGLSYLRTDDSDRMVASDALNANNIGSLDYSWTIIPKKLTLSGESAASFDSVSPNAAAAKNTQLEGLAHRVNLASTLDRHNLGVQYERIDPEFRTLTGAADLDREKVNFNWRWQLSPVTSLATNFLWYRDKLEQPANRTQTYRPQVALNLSKLFKRDTSRMSVSTALEEQRYRGDARANIYTSLSYGDKFFKVLNSSTDLGLTRADSYTPGKDKMDYTLRQSFSTAHTLGANLVMKPTINFGSSYTEDKITNDINKVFDYSLGLVFDLPKTKLTSNLRVGQNRYVSERVDDSEQFYFNLNISYRPESVFGWKTAATLYLSALVNDFSFQTERRDWRETNITMGVTIPLDAVYGKK